ncbi:MAG: ComF family protein [Oscillospiraceae bacterium]|nr:ComF family protein [Oscillospiraceae bacterium]
MKLIDRLLDLIYPPRCIFCGRILPSSAVGVCRACAACVPRVPAGDRRWDIKHIEWCAAPLLYQGTVREALLRYKFNGVTAYGRIFADFMAKSIDEIDFSCDIITWVPLSKRRLRKRGYDQAQILAEELAKRLELPCGRLLEKRIDNKPQSATGDAEKRKENARGVYACPDVEAVRGKRILLVDDIVTTGATLAECARVLKAAGCAAIYAAAAATRQ